MTFLFSAIRYGGWKVSLALRTIVMDAVRDTIWERLVKRIARVDGDPLSTMEIWDIFFQVSALSFCFRFTFFPFFLALRTPFRTPDVYGFILRLLLRESMSDIHTRQPFANGPEFVVVHRDSKTTCESGVDFVTILFTG